MSGEPVDNFPVERLLITKGSGRSEKIAQSNFCIKGANHCKQPLLYSQSETGLAQAISSTTVMLLIKSLLFPTHAQPNDGCVGVNSAGSPRNRPSQATINGCGVHDSTIWSILAAAER